MRQEECVAVLSYCFSACLGTARGVDRRHWGGQRFRRQLTIRNLVEVAIERELLFRPQTMQNLNEFFHALVAAVLAIEPGAISEDVKFFLVPAIDDVDRA